MSKNVEFISNTKKEPHYIKGSKGLYYFQIQVGVAKNGYDNIINYLTKKSYQTQGLLDEFKLGENPRNRKEHAYVIYRKEDDNQSYEDFVKDIESGRIQKIGDMLFSAVNQNEMKVDSNGNILLKSYGADLENIMITCGDILLDSEGNCLRNTRGNSCLREANQFGYYPEDIFISELDKETGITNVVGLTYNFIDPETGKRISNTNYSRPTHLDENQEYIFPIERTYFSTNDGTQFRSKDIYSRGYIYGNRDKVEFFPSALDLIKESRARTAEGKEPIDIDETPYLEEIARRPGQIETTITTLGKRLDSGKLSQSEYEKLITRLDREITKLEEFQNIETM